MIHFPPVTLPPLPGESEPVQLRRPGHLTLVGSSGSGKSRFMESMFTGALPGASLISAVDPSLPLFPPAESSAARHRSGGRRGHTVEPLPLMLIETWESLFPGNKIVTFPDGSVLFRTTAGNDLITSDRLSRGERAALLYLWETLAAPPDSLVFVDSPTLFLHPTVSGPLWDAAERLRRDCRFIYDTTDPSFVASRSHNIVLWVKSFIAATGSWNYEILPAADAGRVYADLIGARRPVLFIEGDAEHSIDSRLYSLVFPDYIVRPLGSCDKVIETTRSFCFLDSMHPLDTLGIVDRDRRSDAEVEYLRRRSVMVAEVAEIENIFLTEPVVRIMAEARRLNPDRIFAKTKEIVFSLFRSMYQAQALQHTRHRVKRDVERKIDGRFTCITALELHIKGLIHTLNPRETYTAILHEFEDLISRRDHAGILRVFNHKPMLTGSAIPRLFGFSNSDEYVAAVLSVLRFDHIHGPRLREAVLALFKPEMPPVSRPEQAPERQNLHSSPRREHRRHKKRY